MRIIVSEGSPTQKFDVGEKVRLRGTSVVGTVSDADVLTRYSCSFSGRGGHVKWWLYKVDWRPGVPDDYRWYTENDLEYLDYEEDDGEIQGEATDS